MLFKVSIFLSFKNEQEGHTLHTYILEIRSKFVSLCGAHGCGGGQRLCELRGMGHISVLVTWVCINTIWGLDFKRLCP